MSCCTNEWFHSLLLELLASLEENFCLFVCLILCDLFFVLFKGLKIILVFEILAVFIITCNLLRVEIYLLLPLHKKIWVSFFCFMPCWFLWSMRLCGWICDLHLVYNSETVFRFWPRFGQEDHYLCIQDVELLYVIQYFSPVFFIDWIIFFLKSSY